jgi:hypothetical protein
MGISAIYILFYTRSTYKAYKNIFFKHLIFLDLWGIVRYYIRWLLKLLRLGLLKLSTRYEGFFINLKRRFLLKESPKENINIFLSLIINGIAYNVIRR